nr:MAG TPA: hypothetical protein [Bacteriophage sp.]
MTDEKGPIAFARETIKDILAGGTSWPVVTNIPPQLIPPCVVVTESSPFVERGNAVGSVIVTFKVLAIAPATDNDHIISLLDAATDKLITHLTSEDVHYTVSGYETVTTADSQSYLASSLTLPLSLHL